MAHVPVRGPSPGPEVNAAASGRSPGILAAAAVCMGLQMTAFVMILPLLPRRLESLGAGVEALGLSAVGYALTGIIAAPFTGMLADRSGRRPIILFSLAAYGLAFGGYLLASSAWMLVALRTLLGFFTAGLIPAVMSVVGDLAAEDRRAQWIGIVNGGASAGWIFGPLLGGLLYDRFGYALPFAVSIAMALGALLLAAQRIPETRTPAGEGGAAPAARRPGLPALPLLAKFFLPLLITFSVLFAWAFIEPAFMFYAYDDLRWTSSQLGLVMSTYGAAFTAGELALGRLSDRLGRKPVLVVGLALFSAQFAGLVLFRDPVWIVLSFLLAGLGNALYDPALSALILDMTPPEHTAGMMGLKGMAGSLGNLLGPVLVVLFTPRVGPRIIFLGAAGLVYLLTLLSGLFLRAPERVEIPREVSDTAAVR